MRICLLSSGLQESNRRLQPWSYLLQVARDLAQAGHDVRLLSDGARSAQADSILDTVPVTRLQSVADRPLVGNAALRRALDDLQPDVVLWHLGLTSFFHLATPGRLPVPVIGLFTSPLYRPRELLRLGAVRLLRGWRLVAAHLLGLWVPDLLLRRVFHRHRLQALVVECDTTRARLAERGLPAHRLHVVRPGIDPAWFDSGLSTEERACIRRERGFRSRDAVVGYFGPPAPLRGLPAVLQAVALARRTNPAIKLLALSRRRDGEGGREQRALEAQFQCLQAGDWARIEAGFLSRARLVRALAACDLVALPFEIVPSDVPLSVLEAMALGLPLVTTDVACLHELVPPGCGLRVSPGDIAALAAAVGALAADGQRRSRLGSAARDRARAWQALHRDERSWSQIPLERGGPP